MTQRIDQVAGVILAGGKSSRFGSNKALALHQGNALIQGIGHRLAGLFPETLLITNTPEEYGFLGWPMAGDQYLGCGPLAGIHAALRTVSQPRIFVCGCDMPLLNPDLVRFLCELEGDHDIVLLRVHALDADRGVPPLVFHQSTFGRLHRAA